MDKYSMFKECMMLGKSLDESWEDMDAFMRACSRWGTLMATIRVFHLYDEYVDWCASCEIGLED